MFHPGYSTSPVHCQLPELPTPREPPGCGTVHRSQHRPRWPAWKQAGPRSKALEFNTQCPALTTELPLQRKHRSAHPQWPKPALFPQTQVENPLKAERLRNNYSFDTKPQLVNIKLWCAKNERNERLCLGDKGKEGECDSLGLSRCWPYCWIREGNWMLMK